MKSGVGLPHSKKDKSRSLTAIPQEQRAGFGMTAGRWSERAWRVMGSLALVSEKAVRTG